MGVPEVAWPTRGRPLLSGVVAVSVWKADGAACCGALGCRETAGLVVVRGERGSRVLCPRCAREWSR